MQVDHCDNDIITSILISRGELVVAKARKGDRENKARMFAAWTLWKCWRWHGRHYHHTSSWRAGTWRMPLSFSSSWRPNRRSTSRSTSTILSTRGASLNHCLSFFILFLRAVTKYDDLSTRCRALGMLFLLVLLVLNHRQARLDEIILASDCPDISIWHSPVAISVIVLRMCDSLI